MKRKQLIWAACCMILPTLCPQAQDTGKERKATETDFEAPAEDLAFYRNSPGKKVFQVLRGLPYSGKGNEYFRACVESAGRNRQFVEYLHDQLRNLPVRYDTGHERKKLFYLISEYRTEWAVRLLGDMLFDDRRLDWTKEFDRVEDLLHSNDAGAPENPTSAARSLHRMGLPGMPLSDLENHMVRNWGDATLESFQGWWRANEHRIGEIVEDAWGEEALYDPRTARLGAGATGGEGAAPGAGMPRPRKEALGSAAGPPRPERPALAVLWAAIGLLLLALVAWGAFRWKAGAATASK